MSGLTDMTPPDVDRCVAVRWVAEPLRTCSRCGKTLPLEGFVKDSRRPGGRTRRCIECHAAQARAYRTRPEVLKRDALRMRERYRSNPDKARERSILRRSDEPSAFDRNPVKERARRRLRQAVHAGRVVKPETCESCGAGGPIHGHHEDYSKPLSVEWLCHRCHMRRHRKYEDDTAAPPSPAKEG